MLITSLHTISFVSCSAGATCRSQRDSNRCATARASVRWTAQRCAAILITTAAYAGQVRTLTPEDRGCGIREHRSNSLIRHHPLEKTIINALNTEISTNIPTSRLSYLKPSHTPSRGPLVSPQNPLQADRPCRKLVSCK